MAKNDVTRVSTPLTGRLKAKREAEVRAQEAADYEARRPKLVARDPRSAPAMSREELETLLKAASPEQRLTDAGINALAAGAAASSLPAAALFTALGAEKLRRDVKDAGAEALVDPANLMFLGGLRAARYGKAYRRPSGHAIRRAALEEADDVAAALNDAATGQGRVVPGPKLSPETQNLPPALRRRGIAILDPDATDVADAIQAQYEAAIGRTSDYRGNLRDHLLSGNGAFLSDRRGGYVAGFPMSDDTFVLSHFAPKTLRGGMEFIKELANDPDVNFIMAVPDYQANMAAKAGFRRVGSIPQWFNGEIVMKNVMVNKRTPEDALAAWMSVSQAAKGGESEERNALNNFLATDDVPPTLFGFEVVTENYTEMDLEFFRQHPSAGGYYDLGEDDGKDAEVW